MITFWQWLGEARQKYTPEEKAESDRRCRAASEYFKGKKTYDKFRVSWGKKNIYVYASSEEEALAETEHDMSDSKSTTKGWGESKQKPTVVKVSGNLPEIIRILEEQKAKKAQSGRNPPNSDMILDEMDVNTILKGLISGEGDHHLQLLRSAIVAAYKDTSTRTMFGTEDYSSELARENGDLLDQLKERKDFSQPRSLIKLPEDDPKKVVPINKQDTTKPPADGTHPQIFKGLERRSYDLAKKSFEKANQTKVQMIRDKIKDLVSSRHKADKVYRMKFKNSFLKGLSADFDNVVRYCLQMDSFHCTAAYEGKNDYRYYDFKKVMVGRTVGTQSIDNTVESEELEQKDKAEFDRLPAEKQQEFEKLIRGKVNRIVKNQQHTWELPLNTAKEPIGIVRHCLRSKIGYFILNTEEDYTSKTAVIQFTDNYKIKSLKTQVPSEPTRTLGGQPLDQSIEDKQATDQWIKRHEKIEVNGYEKLLNAFEKRSLMREMAERIRNALQTKANPHGAYKVAVVKYLPDFAAREVVRNYPNPKLRLLSLATSVNPDFPEIIISFTKAAPSTPDQ